MSDMCNQSSLVKTFTMLTTTENAITTLKKTHISQLSLLKREHIHMEYAPYKYWIIIIIIIVSSSRPHA